MPLARIEMLEDRRQFSASVGLDPAFGTIYTPVGTGAVRPGFAVALSGGRVLVYGVTESGINGDNGRDAFALYSSTGGLGSSFNHHHPLVLDAAASGKFGDVSAMSALPDGSVLVEADSGVHRLRLDGTFDANFGNGGVLPKQAFSAQVQSDGTIRALQVIYDRPARAYKSRLLTFNSQGRYLAATDMIAGRLGRLTDGRPYEQIGDDAFTLYDADLHPDPTFGTNGTVNLSGALARWGQTHGPWYSGTTKLASPQVWTDSLLMPIAGGGYVVHIFTSAAHSPSSTPIEGVYDRFVRIDAHGSVVATGVTADTFSYAGVRFVPTWHTVPYGYTYAFQFGVGGSVPVTLPATISRAFVSARASDGSYFLVGQADPGNGSGFAIVHTLPVVGVISGTVFGDTNENGKVDTNEARLGDRVVYLDENNNGRLDGGETWTTTDADGRYAFDDLGPGQYVVRRVLPKGSSLTRPATTVTLPVGTTLTVQIGSVAA